MTGFSLPGNYTDNPERLMRRAQPRVVPPLAILLAQEPISEAPLVLEAMAEKTLASSPSPPPTMWPLAPTSMSGT